MASVSREFEGSVNDCVIYLAVKQENLGKKDQHH